MAFRIGDIIVDHIQYATFESSNGLLYVLTQLSEATLSTTSDSVDAVDRTGSLVRRVFRGKTCEFTATNALINMNVVAAASGSQIENASAGNEITMPKIITVKKGDTATLTGYVEGSVWVYGLDGSGNLLDQYQKGAAVSATEYQLEAGGAFTPPTAEGVEQYLVKYLRNVESGIAIRNRADKFPRSGIMTLKVIAVDPCHQDELRAGYIEMRSFQVSPDLEITLNTEGTIDYSGTAAQDYCSINKELYAFYWAEDDNDEYEED